MEDLMKTGSCANKRVFIFLAGLAFATMAVLSPSGVCAKAHVKGMPRSASVKIEMKTGDAVFVGERKFVVTDVTSIQDAKGLRMELRDLPVPCQARLEYLLRMDQDPVVSKIKIERVFRGAGTAYRHGEK
jgi:hypothetical protein